MKCVLRFLGVDLYHRIQCAQFCFHSHGNTIRCMTRILDGDYNVRVKLAPVKLLYSPTAVQVICTSLKAIHQADIDAGVVSSKAMVTALR